MTARQGENRIAAGLPQDGDSVPTLALNAGLRLGPLGVQSVYVVSRCVCGGSRCQRR